MVLTLVLRSVNRQCPSISTMLSMDGSTRESVVIAPSQDILICGETKCTKRTTNVLDNNKW